jgi:hypothetical protein
LNVPLPERAEERGAPPGAFEIDIEGRGRRAGLGRRLGEARRDRRRQMQLAAGDRTVGAAPKREFAGNPAARKRAVDVRQRELGLVEAQDAARRVPQAWAKA